MEIICHQKLSDLCNHKIYIINVKSKKEREVIRIFNNKHYLTCGVNENIPQLLQCLMWELINQMPVDKDYLQVFYLSAENGRQKIKHIQEVPEYTKEYYLNSDKPVTEKPAETRMGSGKGSPEYWVAVVKPGRVMFEMDGVSEEVAREAMRLAGHKLPIKTKFIVKETEGEE